MLQPSINSLITKRVEADEIGGILGVSAAFLSAANTLAPIIAGTVFQFGGAAMPFLLGGVAMALLLLLALRQIVPNPRDDMPRESLAAAH
ncbi:MAG: hypothetical protein K8I60_07260 [Anaerolineae bacterium]|nr:hypothetical protein [Anaerolineae bacterium]